MTTLAPFGIDTDGSGHAPRQKITSVWRISTTQAFYRETLRQGKGISIRQTSGPYVQAHPHRRLEAARSVGLRATESGVVCESWDVYSKLYKRYVTTLLLLVYVFNQLGSACLRHSPNGADQAGILPDGYPQLGFIGGPLP